MLNDRNFKEGHAGHLCRVALTPKRIFLADDKERLRPEIEKLKNDPLRRAEYERLVAGRSTAVPANLEKGRWYRMRIDVVGEELSVQLDGRPIARLRSSGIAHPTKTDFYFAVAGESARFDELSIRSLAP